MHTTTMLLVVKRQSLTANQKASAGKGLLSWCLRSAPFQFILRLLGPEKEPERLRGETAKGFDSLAKRGQVVIRHVSAAVRAHGHAQDVSKVRQGT